MEREGSVMVAVGGKAGLCTLSIGSRGRSWGL